MVWEIHELIGGQNDGVRRRLPCREGTIWIPEDIRESPDFVQKDSEVMLTKGIVYRKYQHAVRPDGTHVWEVVK